MSIKQKEQKQFLAGCGFPSSGIDEFRKHIVTQIISEEDSKNLEIYTVLKYSNAVLSEVQAWRWGENDISEEELTSLRKNGILDHLQFENYVVNEYYHFEPCENGIHHLGGDVPTGFVIPDNNCPNSLQYIGRIDNQDPVFDWLPISLHIVYPIYLGFEKLLLDYSDEFEPRIINTEELNSAYSDGALKEGTEVWFEKMSFKLEKENEPGFGMGFSGAPAWTQNQQPPVCPVSNLPMRFVCQLNGDTECKVKSATLNEERQKDFSEYFESMQFSVDWQLYVFFQPVSRIAYLEVTY